VCYLVLVLLQRRSGLLVPRSDSILELRGVITDAILTAEHVGSVRLGDTALLLEVNKNVNGPVELGRNRVAVVIARVLTVRIVLRSNVVASVEDGYLDLASSLNVGRELLNAVEAVRDLEVWTWSDGLGHSENLSRDGVVTFEPLALVSHDRSRRYPREFILVDA
jgi:hypothetical protein